MKLSQLTAQQGIEVIADIMPSIANIAEDKEMLLILSTLKPNEGESALNTIARFMKGGLPKLLKNHKEDIVEILACVNMKSPDEYNRSTGIFKLAKDIYELTQDEDLKYFFSQAETEQKEEYCGPVLVNTEGKV